MLPVQSRQQLGLTLDRTFKPTPNTRLQATFQETKKFAESLRRFDKQIHLHMKSIKGTPLGALVMLPCVLRCPPSRSCHQQLRWCM